MRSTAGRSAAETYSGRTELELTSNSNVARVKVAALACPGGVDIFRNRERLSSEESFVRLEVHGLDEAKVSGHNVT